MVAAMIAMERGSSAVAALRLAARLHEVSAGLAVGIGMLKGSKAADRDRRAAIEVFEQVLVDLRKLSQETAAGVVARRRPATVRETLQREAKSVGVDLELRIKGRESSLSEGPAELVSLVGREAIRNVKRHSGAGRCRITIDLSARPFVMTAQDWGAGIVAGAPTGGIKLLEALAREMGADLRISSQPGLGVALTLIGPSPALNGDASQSNHRRLRSVVAEESLSSRKRVATRRPIRAPGQQINQA
jgi:signal transduction histidine kinase